MPRPVLVLVALGGLVAIAAYAAGSRTSPPAAPAVEVLETTSTITVHVSGAVARPGLVQVLAGARLAEVIVAAGGATPEADLGAINLASPVADGSHVQVPALGGLVPGGDERVPVNSATVDQLTELPGIGPVLAQRIVDHREGAGAFARPEDLLDVPGIGERLLAGLRDLIVVP